MNPQELNKLIDFLRDQVPAFIVGVIAGLITEAIIYAVSKTTFILRIEKWLSTKIIISRLRRVNNFKDPHAQIRHEWSLAIRDIGSSHQRISAVAIEMLIHMRDVLESDERRVAFEALRLRFALNNHRENDKKYAKALSLYSE